MVLLEAHLPWTTIYNGHPRSDLRVVYRMLVILPGDFCEVFRLGPYNIQTIGTRSQNVATAKTHEHV